MANCLAIIYPSFKSIYLVEYGNQEDYFVLLNYWIIFSLIVLLEGQSSTVINSFFPLYYLLKCCLLSWMYSENGSGVAYSYLILPLYKVFWKRKLGGKLSIVRSNLSKALVEGSVSERDKTTSNIESYSTETEETEQVSECDKISENVKENNDLIDANVDDSVNDQEQVKIKYDSINREQRKEDEKEVTDDVNYEVKSDDLK
ncbi:receptor expression-enhancing protein 3-B-like isoform X2 [Centruroides sculpturatus]|nr:receptor expression-enhancing protein 3-B-like [Centruroides sculpturatus]XP_023209890.1 receptor expression-enhancing protein 3-B-like isoform X2 [Centruroides sculpturatus]